MTAKIPTRFNPADRNLDGKVSLGERARVGLSFFQCFVALGACSWMMDWLIRHGDSIAAIRPLGLIVTGAGIAASLLALVPLASRHIIYYIVDLKEMLRLRAEAIEDRQAVVELKKEIPTGTKVYQSEIDDLVRIVLTQFWRGGDPTRDGMTAAGLLTKPQWDDASAAISAVDMRVKKNPPVYWGKDFPDSWREYLERSHKKTKVAVVNGEPVKTIR